MQNFLLLAPLAVIFIFSLFHRGGISLHSHLLWGGLIIIPAFALLFSRTTVMQNNTKRILMYSTLTLFIIFFLISIQLAEIQGYGIYEFLAYISGIITFFIISNISFSPKTLDKILGRLCATAAVISFIGLMFFMLLAPNRVFGTFIGWDMLSVSFPNAFALFLLIILPITVYKVIASKDESLKLYFIAAIIQFSAFILTFSRESWVVLIIAGLTACAILLFKSKSTRALLLFSLKRLVPIIIISFLIAYGGMAVRGLKYETPSVYKKISFQADEKLTSFSDRTNLWKNSLKTFAEHPFLGEGPGVFQEKTGSHQHNLFLKIANDSGIFALMFFIAFLAMIGCGLKSNCKDLPRHSKNTALVLAVSVGLALAQNMVDYNLNFVSNAFLFWLILGIIASIIFKKKFSFGKTIHGYQNIYVIFAALLSIPLLIMSVHEGFYKIDYAEGKKLYQEKKYEDALEKFESAQNLVFKQDLPYLIGQTYYDLAQAKGWEYFGAVGNDFLTSLPKEEKTMKVSVLSAEFCLISPAYDCLKWAIPSLKNTQEYIEKNLNPFKFIRIRYDYYYALYKAKKYDDLKAELAGTEKFLENYLAAVRQNEQLTITTENPVYALKTYDVFIDLTKTLEGGQQKINKLTISKVRLSRTIIDEKKKYEALYGQPAYEE